MSTYIVAAAIKVGDVICSVPRPGRHHNVIWAMAEAGFPTPIVGEQGFIDSAGQFWGRKFSLIIAQREGQIATKIGNPTELFSEDLW